MNQENQQGSQSKVYPFVADWIRGKIYDSSWGPGDRLPSEVELASQLGVSRGTVKKGIAQLVGEGLLQQERGRGTFVTKPSLLYATGSRFLSFAESLRSQGIDFTTDVLRQDVCRADGVAARKLIVALGAPVLRLNRLRRTGDDPILLQESQVNLTACPGLEGLDYTKTPLFDAMQESSGRQIGYSKAHYSARVAGRERGRLLHRDERTPLLCVDMVVHLEDNTPIEWVKVWLPSDTYELSSVMQRY